MIQEQEGNIELSGSSALYRSLQVSLGLSVLSPTFCKAKETAGRSTEGQGGGKPREIFIWGFYCLWDGGHGAPQVLDVGDGQNSLVSEQLGWNQQGSQDGWGWEGLTDHLLSHGRDTSTIPGCSWARSWDPRGAVNTLGAQLCLTHPLPCFFGQIPVVLGLQAGVAGSTGNCRQLQMPAVLWLPGHEAAEPGPGMSEG